MEPIFALARAAAAPSADPVCLHHFFAAQAQKTPDGIALSFGSEQVRYAELDVQANRWAAGLRAHGAARGSFVALYLERSCEMVAAILAVLKTGAAYVPIDLTYPRERVAFILRDTAAPILLTTERFRSALPETQANVLCVEELSDPPHPSPSAPASQPDDLAYVIYTSGSTGLPKGVMVTHHNVVRLLSQTQAWYQFGPGDVWPLFHSYAFDVSVWEIWGSLLHGGRLVIVPYATTRSPVDFYQLLSREGVTVLNQTPSAFRQLIWAEGVAPNLLPLSLRYVICAGEALELQSLRPWFERHGDAHPQVVNMYGITETTVHSTYRVIRQSDLDKGLGSVIGIPIPDLQLHLLDQQLRPVPSGETGEICVGGAGVARGYLNRPELSRQRFVPDPFSAKPGAVLYRSGDLARRTADGELEYLGRMDHQVKIRGFRVELGEIESALNAHPAIRESAVLPFEDKDAAKRLIAYFVPHQLPPPVTELRRALGQALPDYMIPAQFIALPALPLNTNGKVDRKSLPVPGRARPALETPYAAPASGSESVLTQIWQEVLQLAPIGVHDNYFELGGDSIRSIRLLARAWDEGLQIQLADLYQAPTIAALAARARSGAGQGSTNLIPFSLVAEADRLKLPPDAVDAYPITRLQMGMFFRNDLDPLSAIYHDVFSYRTALAFDPARMRQAILELTRRHLVFRTSFHLAGFSEPLQVVHQSGDCRFTFESIEETPGPDDPRVTNWIEREKRRPLDREFPGLARFHVLSFQGGFQLFLSFHHSCLDGWSLAVVVTELLLGYHAMLKGQSFSFAPLSASYAQYVALERECLAAQDQRRFWCEKLANAVPGEVPRWPRQFLPGGREQRRGPQFWLEGERLRRLQKLAQSAAAPLKSVLLAAHLKVMSFLCVNPDVTTGLITNGRPEAKDGEQLAGLFLNATPFRLHVDSLSWLQLVKNTLAGEQELLPYRRFPMAEIQRLTGRRLFETAFDFVHFHVFEKLLSQPDLRFVDGPYFEANDMALYTTFLLDVSSKRLELHIDYDPERVSPDQAAQITECYLETLGAMSEDPAADPGQFSPLSSSERGRLLVDWNRTEEHIPDLSLPELIERQAQKSLHAPAVSSLAQVLNYQQLQAESNRLATALRQVGIGPGDRVGICLERSVNLVSALLGILKTGAAYVPLDPAFPRDRLAFMLSDAGPRALVTQTSLLPLLRESAPAVLVLENLPEMTASSVGPAPKPDDLAYVIYTSGSTGGPKGVEITHRSLVNALWSLARLVAFQPSDKILAVTTLSFDIAALELFLPLLLGGQVEIAPREVVSDGRELARYLAASGATFMQATPTSWKLLLAAGWAGTPGLTVLCGGEPLKPALANDLSDRSAKVYNLYGPTETTIWSTLAEVRKGLPVTIGRPIANTQVFILDSQLRPVPIGAPGELCIAGRGVARGYSARPELTAKKFVPNPFDTGESAVLYRTGDIARWLPDGSLECLGRSDRQVKIRGYRVETGEIENVLRLHPAIADAVVVASDDAFGDQRLIGYVISKNGPPPLPEVRAFAANRLPAYMVPAHLLLVPGFPTTPNGKLDLQRLPPPNLAATRTRQPIPPRTELEKLIAAIFQEVLSAGEVSVEDNFFEIGGDSLCATRAFARLGQQLGAQLSLRDLFENPTVARLAAVIASSPAHRQTHTPIPKLPR